MEGNKSRRSSGAVTQIRDAALYARAQSRMARQRAARIVAQARHLRQVAQILRQHHPGRMSEK
jgi:hypothetical protein